MKKLFPFLIAFAVFALAMGGVQDVEARVSGFEPCSLLGQLKGSRVSSRKSSPLQIHEVENFEQFMQEVLSNEFFDNSNSYISQCEGLSQVYSRAKLMPNGARYQELSDSYQLLGKYIKHLSDFPVLVAVDLAKPGQSVVTSLIPEELVQNMKETFDRIKGHQPFIYQR